MVEGVSDSVIKTAELCAERGWAGTYTFKTGEVLAGAFITATDEEQAVVVLERPGERDLKPRIVYLKDVENIEPHWS